MAYSYFDYEGTDTTIQTDILCVSTEHMYALEVLSEEKSNVTLSDVALAATFTKNNAGVLCELKTAPSTKIRVIRSTPYDVLMHDFSNGAQFNADSVDEVYEQLLYLYQELVEGKLVIDSSGNFGGTSAVYISQNELQAELAAQHSLGYSAGEDAGDAAGYARGYARGYSEGDAAGKAAGYLEGEAAGYSAGEAAGYGVGYSEGAAAGDAAGYARGYSEGETAGKAAGEAAGKAVGDAEGYARGYSEGEAAGYAAGSGSGSGGGCFEAVKHGGLAIFEEYNAGWQNSVHKTEQQAIATIEAHLPKITKSPSGDVKLTGITKTGNLITGRYESKTGFDVAIFGVVPK